MTSAELKRFATQGQDWVNRFASLGNIFKAAAEAATVLETHEAQLATLARNAESLEAKQAQAHDAVTAAKAEAVEARRVADAEIAVEQERVTEAKRAALLAATETTKRQREAEAGEQTVASVMKRISIAESKERELLSRIHDLETTLAAVRR